MTTGVELSEAKRQLLQRMMSGASPARSRDAARILPRAAGARVPMSADQAQVWLHAQMALDVPLYNESITIHRRGPFDFAVMERSLNEVLRRHEIWRTSLDVVDGDIVQVVRPDLRVPLGLDDLTALPACQRDREALRLATHDARRPINLHEAPLFRVRMVKLAEDDHRLYLTLHHIVFDGVSIYRVFVPELAAIYAAFSRGAASPLAEPALQYGDYAIWRQQSLDGERIERQIEYWRGALGGVLPKLELPTDHARPPVPTYRGAMETFTLSLELTEALKALSRAQGATLYMTLLAAFKAMLFRYSGQEDILIGGVTDMRRRPELEQLMGYFLNTMALRTRPGADLPFREFLAQTRVTVLGALDASEAPFDRVLRELSIRREPGAHPLFQVLFSIEPPVGAFPDGWDLTQMDVTVGGAKFDLYLELDERPDGMIGRFLYGRDLFEPETIRRMISHWHTILEAVVADPGCTLGRLPMLTPAESQQLLQTWNQTQAPLPAATLHQWFQAQARRTPEAIAVTLDDETWTYRELDRRSDAVAARLSEKDVKAGSLAGICMNRSPEMVAGLLGILKTGAAYLPLDPGFPLPRLAFVLDDAKPAALLTQSSLLAMLPAGHAPIVLCEGEAGLEPGPDDTSAVGERLAYVIYTSGSTGQPKGVEVTHGSLVNLLAAMQRAPGFGPKDSLLAVTTLSFDIAALELFLPLVSGGRLILAPSEGTSDPPRLAHLIPPSDCTVMQATPATWRGLIEAGWAGTERLKILCGGEALPRALAEDLLHRARSVWNMYGPTETTIWSAVHNVEAGSGPVPIGRPIGNTQLYILDPGGAPVPIGVVGELHIGGAGLARGYRNRPDLTQDRFVERAAAGGARLYRTGDLARYLPGGMIECLGRIDAEEKIRGFRVAVEEVEAALARHPDIGSAAVRAWPDASGSKALTGYFVARTPHESTVAELRRFLGELLPDYMVPSHFMRIDALPMTPNGKVDRKSLPPPHDGGLARPVSMPPEGQTELALAEIWKSVLAVPAVGRNEDFFDLGGHSLLAAKLLRRIELEFGRRLPMAAFFNAPSIEAVARLLNEGAMVDSPVTIAIQPQGSRPPLLWLDGNPTFRALSQAIGLDQPFLGIPVDTVLELNAASDTRFEELASVIVKEVRKAQPEGPYYLGGWCNMGILAYEVASQLSEAGQTVGLVLLLHATNPVSYRRISRVALISSQIRYHWPRFWRQRGDERGDYLAARLRGFRKSVDWLKVRSVDRQTRLRAAFERTAREYAPPIYFGDVALFQPTLRIDVMDYRPGWAERVRGHLSAHDIPGAHGTMLDEPNVQDLGALIRAALLQAQQVAQTQARVRVGA